MDKSEEKKVLKGSQILLESLIHQGVDTVFGYPGGQIMPVYDALYDYKDSLRHILVRHEQGAIHAAQGYARIKNRPGTVIVTSGPGVTNVITGVADAMIDSTPVVVIAGQVGTGLLGTDAFQETDLVGMATPIAKWAYQIRRPEDVAWAVARAYYIAGSGRPGPVVLDFPKDAQTGTAEYIPKECSFIRSYVPYPEPSDEVIAEAARMIDEARKPFVVYGHGIILSEAEEELEAFLDKGDFPAGSTMLGLSAIKSDNPHYLGMLGMHGSLANNYLTQNCDLLIAVGMRFDDRITGTVSTYAKQAKIIHIDIDASEIGKNIPVDLGVLGDAAGVLRRLTAAIRKRDSNEWGEEIATCTRIEKERVIDPEIKPESGMIRPGEVVTTISDACGGNAVVVTDVGQNQLFASRYFKFNRTRSLITSGGLGTMGFGLPAALGAKIAAPERPVCLFVGDGGIQMTVQELGTMMQENIGVKIILLNNNWLGNVRQFQELLYSRYSFTRMLNPDYGKIAEAYGIDYVVVEKREELAAAVERMFADGKSFILNIHVAEEDDVFPMILPGKSVDEILLNATDWFEYGK